MTAQTEGEKLPFTCSNCGKYFGWGDGSAPILLGIVNSIPFTDEPTPCCGYKISGTNLFKKPLTRAWYLNMIAGGATSMFLFMKASDMSFVTIKMRIKSLLADGFIKDHSGSRTAYWKLTEDGVRELQRHDHELEEAKQRQSVCDDSGPLCDMHRKYHLKRQGTPT